MFAEVIDVSMARAYEILRKNPDLVIKLGPRQLRVDGDKLSAWIEQGGCAKASGKNASSGD